MRFLLLAMGPQGLGKAGIRLRRQLGAYLSGELEAHLEVVALDSYDDLLQAIQTHTAALAWLPPAVYVMAADLSGAVLLGRAIRHGSESYRGALIVRSDASVRSLESLSGKTVGWVHSTSCAGYLFPRMSVRERGFDPDTHFGDSRFVGSHPAVAQAVFDGVVDVGATYVHLLEDDVVDGGWTRVVGADAIRPLVSSPPIPGDTLCASAKLDAGLRNQMAAALARLHQQREGQAILQGLFQAAAIEPADPDDYEIVRRALRA